MAELVGVNRKPNDNLFRELFEEAVNDRKVKRKDLPSKSTENTERVLMELIKQTT